MAALKRSTNIDRNYCGGNFKWRFVGKYNCSFKVSILNHFLWTWKPTITTSFTNRQLVTSYEILVASTEFLVTLATRKAQFRTLDYSIWHCFIKMCQVSLTKGGPKLNLSPGIPFRKKTANQEQQWVQFEYRSCYWMLLSTYIILCKIFFFDFLYSWGQRPISHTCICAFTPYNILSDTKIYNPL